MRVLRLFVFLIVCGIATPVFAVTGVYKVSSAPVDGDNADAGSNLFFQGQFSVIGASGGCNEYMNFVIYDQYNSRYVGYTNVLVKYFPDYINVNITAPSAPGTHNYKITGLLEDCNGTTLDSGNQWVSVVVVSPGDPYVDLSIISDTFSGLQSGKSFCGDITIRNSGSSCYYVTNSKVKASGVNVIWSDQNYGTNFTICGGRNHTLTHFCGTPSSSGSLMIDLNLYIESGWKNNIDTVVENVQACNENWSCGSWGSCSNGSQSRTCTDLNSCGTTSNKPALSQSCTCTTNWSCGSWGICSGGVQTRTCSDLNNCGTTSGMPSQAQSCCSSNWSCGSWGVCSNGSQSRTCTDVAGCQANYNETQSCCSSNWSCGSWGVCSNGSQSRTCTDVAGCQSSYNQSQACSCNDPCGQGSIGCLGGQVWTCSYNQTSGCYVKQYSSCAVNETCSGGVCVCTNECIANSSGCQDISTQWSCVYNSLDGCLDKSYSYCSGGYICQGGSCVVDCTDQCISDSFQCQNNVLEKCQLDPACYGWVQISSCSHGCSSSACNDIPTVMLFTTNSGSYVVGGQIDISWSTTGDLYSTVDIQLTCDGGISWFDILPSTPNDGFERYDVSSSITGTQCQVKLIAYDDYDYHIDTTNGYFVISDQPEQLAIHVSLDVDKRIADIEDDTTITFIIDVTDGRGFEIGFGDGTGMSFISSPAILPHKYASIGFYEVFVGYPESSGVYADQQTSTVIIYTAPENIINNTYVPLGETIKKIDDFNDLLNKSLKGGN